MEHHAENHSLDRFYGPDSGEAPEPELDPEPAAAVAKQGGKIRVCPSEVYIFLTITSIYFESYSYPILPQLLVIQLTQTH
jgi:hypothetical protein